MPNGADACSSNFRPMVTNRPLLMARVQAARGFTLVEVLVVIGIVAILLAILLPTLSRARVGGVDIACKANLRQLHTAQVLYAGENKGRLTPPRRSQTVKEQWLYRLWPYLDAGFSLEDGDADREIPDMLWCPGEPRIENSFDDAYTYGLNSFMAMPPWQSRLSVRGEPSKLIVLADKTLGGLDGGRHLVHTEDGFILQSIRASNATYYGTAQATAHSSYGAYRHTHTKGNRDAHDNALGDGAVQPYFDIKGLNAVMLDGHVQSLLRSEMLLDSPLWHPDRAAMEQLAVFDVYAGPCCN